MSTESGLRVPASVGDATAQPLESALRELAGLQEVAADAAPGTSTADRSGAHGAGFRTAPHAAAAGACDTPRSAAVGTDAAGGSSPADVLLEGLRRAARSFLAVLTAASNKAAMTTEFVESFRRNVELKKHVRGSVMHFRIALHSVSGTPGLPQAVEDDVIGVWNEVARLPREGVGARSMAPLLERFADRLEEVTIVGAFQHYFHSQRPSNRDILVMLTGSAEHAALLEDATTAETKFIGVRHVATELPTFWERSMDRRRERRERSGQVPVRAQRHAQREDGNRRDRPNV